MTHYCMETGAGRGEVLVHKIGCGSFDLGTLLGKGNVSSLGELASSEAALNEARKLHANAIRCVDCCLADLVTHDNKTAVSGSNSDESTMNPIRGWTNEGSPVRHFPPAIILEPRPETRTTFTGLSREKSGEYAAVMLA